MYVAEEMSINEFQFAGVKFYSGSLGNLITIIDQWIKRNAHEYMCVTNIHGLTEAQYDKRVFRAHRQAGLVVPDGMPLVWAGRISGYPHTRRIYGPDVLLEVCRQAERHKYRVFLYGTTPFTLDKLTARLKQLYPKLLLVGAHAPPLLSLTGQEKKKVITKINGVHPHIIFIGLSTPKQEMWMYTYRHVLTANVCIGVGAAFDFVSGTRPQAPVWMRHAGLEWIYRLFHEPRRLWPRYKKAGMHFLPLFIDSVVRAIIPHSR
jgi:N-acetylglucosaminyldiphosphoundecaprenol N-acetyl-beta-D-mannosaminyltransferase